MARLLIAFDGSPPSRAAVERSAALFPGAEAVVASAAAGLGELRDSASTSRLALPDEVIRTAVDRLRRTALEQTQELVDEGVALAASAGLDARGDVVPTDGGVWRALAGLAGDRGADVVVCGTNGHGAAGRALLGSVSTGLVREAGRPVLVVPAEAAAGEGPVVIGFDDSEPAQRAAAAAGRLFAGREAVVLHVWRSEIRHTVAGRALAGAPIDDLREIVDGLDGLFDDWAQEAAERGAALAREHGLDARARWVESGGQVARAILDDAVDHDAAAIVVGRRGLGAVASAVLGSVSTAVLHGADRPVLVG